MSKVLFCLDILLFYSINYLIQSTHYTEKYKSSQRGKHRDFVPLIGYCYIILKTDFLCISCYSGFSALLLLHLKLRQSFSAQIIVLILDILNGLYQLSNLIFFLYVQRIISLLSRSYF